MSLNGRQEETVAKENKWVAIHSPLASFSIKKIINLNIRINGNSGLWHQLSSFTDLKASIAAAAAKSLQSCPTLCDPIDSSPLGSTVPGILQARTLEWVAISFSKAWKWKVKMKSLSCVRLLATPWTEGPPGSSVYGIFQARVLEWGATAFSESKY